jgi:hypothetical protein
MTNAPSFAFPTFPPPPPALATPAHDLPRLRFKMVRPAPSSRVAPRPPTTSVLPALAMPIRAYTSAPLPPFTCVISTPIVTLQARSKAKRKLDILDQPASGPLGRDAVLLRKRTAFQFPFTGWNGLIRHYFHPAAPSPLPTAE